MPAKDGLELPSPAPATKVLKRIGVIDNSGQIESTCSVVLSLTSHRWFPCWLWCLLRPLHPVTSHYFLMSLPISLSPTPGHRAYCHCSVFHVRDGETRLWKVKWQFGDMIWGKIWNSGLWYCWVQFYLLEYLTLVLICTINRIQF